MKKANRRKNKIKWNRRKNKKKKIKEKIGQKGRCKKRKIWNKNVKIFKHWRKKGKSAAIKEEW